MYYFVDVENGIDINISVNVVRVVKRVKDDIVK